MLETNIRRAETADVATIEGIVRDAYAHYIERLGKPPGPMLDDYGAHVRRGDAWVLEDRGVMAGILILKSHDDHVLVDNVAVAPAYHGRGFGDCSCPSPKPRRNVEVTGNCGSTPIS